MTFQNYSSEEEDYNEENFFDLIPKVKALHDRCVAILDQCKTWNEKKPIEGLYRYTNSLTAEMHFIEKVKNNKHSLISVAKELMLTPL